MKVRFLLFLVTIAIFYGCSKKEEDIPQDVEIQDFIWKGLNAYYLWQGEKPDLSDRRFSSQNQLNNFLAGFNSPNELFDNLLYKKGEVDKFSWIVNDYVALENSFKGITLSNGMEFGLVRYKDTQTNVFGYVRYVIPGSDAEAKNIKRGMIFNEIDGNQIDENNFRTLISKDNYTISLADYNGGNPVKNGITIQLSKSQLDENPVKIVKTFFEGTEKIGYLMYNQFTSSYDGNLNTAFSQFKTRNITDLIIDLRYNGGGSVRTTTYLGGMITGQFNNEVFSKQQWNRKVMTSQKPEVFVNRFTDKILNKDRDGNVILSEAIKSLNLTRVYFIVSNATASASELIINSLSPYIDVKVIGDITRGKHVGSITLYDSDNYSRNGANLSTKHTWAMQPIVLEIVNKNNENHPNGIAPTVELKEDYGNLGVLGEKSDPLLNTAINYVLTGVKPLAKTNTSQLKEVVGSKVGSPSYNNMYVELK